MGWYSLEIPTCWRGPSREGLRIRVATLRSGVDNGGRTILLVEDNEDNRIVYTTILRYYGYQVLEAHDGIEGVSLARQAHPDLILMDVGLPGLDGWEATRRLKADEQTRQIPVVALTAHALAEHRAQAIAAGCDGYLAKPVEPREVVAEVRRHIGLADRPPAVGTEGHG
jgi:two-component system, cell cycle response regulator DivK